jgi:hydrogenase maturation protein HypF
MREGKPFAVMFRDVEAVRRFARLPAAAEAELTSWRRPVVLLQTEGEATAPSVSMGFPTVGAILPYMPFHYLLFEQLPLPALVFTSGNLSDEPIVIDDGEARSRLGPVTDAVLTYNRRIHNRTDDSVVRFVRERRRVLRRSRGFAPAPVIMPFPVDNILATGAELVNCFCLGREDQAIMSQHIGDLKNYETYAFFTESVERMTRLFRVEPSLVACDLHPDYLSTRYAQETGLPLTAVQHHHAHVAAVMAEHGLTEKVIGVSFDGTGLGDDGHIWGGEFLVCDLAGYRRITHLGYVPMPGGDRAVMQPWRMALAYLYHAFGEEMAGLSLPVVEKAGREGFLDPVMTMIRQEINTPLTSSAGRLFDAVAALTGICTTSTFHAEAPMRLEAAATEGEKGVYPWERTGTVDMTPLIRAVVADIRKKVSPALIAARFHNTLIEMITTVTEEIREAAGIGKVVLTGGAFQNSILLAGTEEMLEKKGFEVFRPLEFPVNDGGIALGQLAVAGWRKMEA